MITSRLTSGPRRLITAASAVALLCTGYAAGTAFETGFTQPVATLIAGVLVVVSASIAYFGQTRTRMSEHDENLRAQRIEVYANLLDAARAIIVGASTRTGKPGPAESQPAIISGVSDTERSAIRIFSSARSRAYLFGPDTTREAAAEFSRLINALVREYESGADYASKGLKYQLSEAYVQMERCATNAVDISRVQEFPNAPSEDAIREEQRRRGE